MTQIKVILTKDKVYTTFYKTIHACEKYVNNVDNGDRYNDPSAQMCRSLAFSLASRTQNPICSIVDWGDKQVTDKDIFEYIDSIHK